MGRTSEKDSATANVLVWEASLSLRTSGSPPPHRDTRVNTTGKKDTAASGLVQGNFFGYVGLSFFSPSQRNGGRWVELSRGTQLWEAASSGRPLFLCGLTTCLSCSEMLGSWGLGWGEPRAITPLPRQEAPGSLAWGNSFHPLRQHQPGTHGSTVVPDKQSRPDNTTETLKINLPLE